MRTTTSETRRGQRDVLHHFRHCSFSTGELARVRSLLDEHGKSLILPYDQFIEHDCRHLEADSDSGDPHYIMQLALEGGYTGVAVHYGISKRYWSRHEGAVPLVVKLNGKTAIPSQARAFSSLTANVEDAVRVGAVAVGYTMYYGSPRESDDFPQLASVRRECERFGMPLIVWAYPRGEDIDRKGGPDTSYALESAARVAMEMGATIIKSNVPKAAKPDFLESSGVPSYYRKLEKELQEMPADEAMQARVDRVVQAAQGVPVLFSGGSELGDDDLLYRAEVCVKAGCLGFIFGRNMWKREKSKALEVTERLKGLLHEAV
ncbi:MAG: fructose-bisphosphate aldolase [Planctomycetes bacterium]|nr:fructose-bisphosphate aldolase [Planctomycetota bacterium]